MPSQVATAYVQIIPSAQGIGGGIAQALGGDAAATSAGQSFGGKLVGAIKGVIAAAGIGTALSKAITEGAALEQSIGGVETLFGDAASQVIAAADNAFATAGLSANAYMETVTGFSARLLQGLGGDTQAAAALADTAVTDMADNANKMGTSMETITQTYQSLARGNYEMLDNLKLGYGGTQSEMARLINDSGVLGDTMVATAENVNSIGFDKMIEAIHVVQTEMGITGTTALEAETTITGSLNALQASFSNVLANLTLGRDLGPSLNALATTLTTFLTGNLLPAIWNILSALPGALVTFVTSLGPQLVTGLQGLVSQITSGMTTSLPQMVQSGATMVQGIVQGITEFLPVSSSGHLQIAKELLGVELEENLSFDVTLHAATVLSTIVVFRHEILRLVQGLFSRRFNEEQAYVLKLILSMLPIGIVGFLFKEQLNAMLESPAILAIVGAMLLLTAALLAFAYYAKPRPKEQISYRDALLIGVAQACAAMPGLSRSGSTIATGLLLGNRKAAVAQFSFLMVLAPIMGETLLEAAKGELTSGIGTVPMLCGFLAAFVTGWLACRFMIEIVKRGKLIWFALYCTAAGIVSILSYTLHA